jgi:hypothetical protein
MTTLPQNALALVGSSADAQRINERLRAAAADWLMISPATSCGRLPRGVEVMTTLVPIDPETEAYPVDGGKFSLSRVALLKLQNAAGFCWDARSSGRVHDVGEPVHPHYVHFRAVGGWRDFSGTWLVRDGDARLDLREGSEAARKMLESASPKTKKIAGVERNLTGPEVGRLQLRDARAKILERAQSGAKLRALRDAFCVRAYTAKELKDKPFVIFRPMYIGTEDIEDRRAIRDSYLHGAAMLFGSAAAAALPPPASEPPILDVEGVLEDPTPEPMRCDYCGTEEEVIEGFGKDGAAIRACKNPSCRQCARNDASGASAAAVASSPATAEPASRASTPPSTEEGPRARFGRCKGKLLSEIGEPELRWLAEAINRSLLDRAKAQYRASNERHLDQVSEELARRFARRTQDASSCPLPPFGEPIEEDDIPF